MLGQLGHPTCIQNHLFVRCLDILSFLHNPAIRCHVISRPHNSFPLHGLLNFEFWSIVKYHWHIVSAFVSHNIIPLLTVIELACIWSPPYIFDLIDEVIFCYMIFLRMELKMKYAQLNFGLNSASIYSRYFLFEVPVKSRPLPKST